MITIPLLGEVSDTMLPGKSSNFVFEGILGEVINMVYRNRGILSEVINVVYRNRGILSEVINVVY